MLATIIAFVSLGQLSPDTILDNRMHDARLYRRVQIAKSQADQWAAMKAYQLFPATEIARVGLVNPPRSQRLRQMQKYSERVLKHYSYKQICDAYDISEKEFVTVINNPRVSSLPHDSEGSVLPGDDRQVRMARGQFDLNPTRFNPDWVILPDKLANQIRYINPKKPARPEMHSKEAMERMKESK